MFRASYDAARRTQGDENNDTLTLASNLAHVLQLLGQLDDAEVLFRRVLAMRRSRLGPENHKTQATAQNLAVVLRDLGKPAEAELLARQALEVDRRVLGPNHTQTVQAMEILAATLLDMGRLAEAEPLARDALAIRATSRTGRGGAHFVQGVLGGCLAAQGRDADAEPLLVASYEGFRTSRGDGTHRPTPGASAGWTPTSQPTRSRAERTGERGRTGERRRESLFSTPAPLSTP
jgi:tetratricopeptide (TPR) repeat protein